jgi:hypothetical protein
MKSGMSKPKKHQRTMSSKVEHTCGTLSYLAECRGVTKKNDAPQWTAPPDSINKKNNRKYPADS